MLQVLILALVLAINNFVGAVSLTAAGLNRRDKARVVAAFGLADCVVPIAGVLLGSGLAAMLGPSARYTGAAIILLTAVYIFASARGGAPALPVDLKLAPGALALSALALSMDNLGAGVGLGAMGYPLAAVLALFGAMTAGMTLAGVALGGLLHRRIGTRNGNRIAGTLLFVTGCLMLASRLHVG